MTVVSAQTVQPTSVLDNMIWSDTVASTTVTSHCTPLALPSLGILVINSSYTITLSQDAIFEPECTSDVPLTASGEPSSMVGDLRTETFYTSVIPQAYAVAATTTLSYMLLVMLLITPRAIYASGSSRNGGGFTSQGVISVSQANSAVVGIGRRPWLQVIATATVVISLTIAITEMTRTLEGQYETGNFDGGNTRDAVANGQLIRIIRVISDTCLWLAQIQTLIRLFPRHREKIIIKWAGFCMIFLETVFSALNTFLAQPPLRSAKFEDAIPALTYLFQLALSLLYACCVIYYALTKRRLAFYHPQEKNICLVAMLALASIFIPIVFFILDISRPDLDGWGDFVRWVGAAAASVVVWEWVERIEGLEREEMKDGVLGREVFDGDEMLEVTASEELSYRPVGSNYYNDDNGMGHGGGDGGFPGIVEQNRLVVPKPSLNPSRRTAAVTSHVMTDDDLGVQVGGNGHSNHTRHRMLRISVFNTHRNQTNQPHIGRIASPIQRSASATTNTSSGSTVYAVRHQQVIGATPPIYEGDQQDLQSHEGSIQEITPVARQSGGNASIAARNRE
jgi:hypothetical protein